MSEVRLCQLLYSGLGGHASVAFSLLSADTAREFDHHMLFYGVEPLLERYRTEAEQSEIRFEFIQKQRGLDRKSWQEVFDTLCLWQPQVVVLHSTNLILPVAKYCKKYNAVLIAVEHTAMAAKRRIEHMYARLCRKQANSVVLLTETYREEYLQRYGTKMQEKISVIPNGINTDFYVPDEAKKSKTPVISMVGRFSPQKDQLTLIKAVEKMKTPVVLKLAGNGDHLTACSNYVETHGLNGKVQFTGVLNEDEIRALLQESTLYVQSSHEENMPTSVMQAMACGIPVIGTDIPGIRNLIQTGQDGWLVPAGNADRLAMLTDELLQHQERLNLAGKQARLKAETLFSHTRMIRAYIELISRS